MKKINIHFDTEIDLEFSVHVIGFTPERPAPACSNPSSPRFADPGDPAEYEDIKFFLKFEKEIYKNGKFIKEEKNIEITDSDIIEFLSEKIDDEIQEQYQTNNDFDCPDYDY